MDTFATGALIVLALILFGNYRQGTLGDWLRAKFLNAAAPRSASELVTGALEGGAELVSVGLETAGSWLRPAGGTVTDTFGAPRPGSRTHAGIDFAARTGTPVVAARAGRVIFAASSAGYGKRIDLDHGGGITTRYAHLSEISVRLGQNVAAGAVIGRVGSTGRSTGPHLHFEIRRDGIAVDPEHHLSSAIGVSA